MQDYTSWDQYEREDLRLINTLAERGWKAEFDYRDVMAKRNKPGMLTPTNKVSFKKGEWVVWYTWKGWRYATNRTGFYENLSEFFPFLEDAIDDCETKEKP